MKTKILIIFGIIAAALTAYFMLNKKTTDEKLTANTTPKALAKPITPNTPITKEEQKFIDLNGFELPSIIILKVIDPISTLGAVNMQVYTKKLNVPLKENQMGWTRNGEEVFKKFNSDGSFFYTIVPYVSEEEPPQRD